MNSVSHFKEELYPFKTSQYASVISNSWWLSYKNPPANAEDTDWSLGWEDPLVKEMATHSSFLAWEIP